jgi:hypothetical protein
LWSFGLNQFDVLFINPILFLPPLKHVPFSVAGELEGVYTDTSRLLESNQPAVSGPSRNLRLNLISAATTGLLFEPSEASVSIYVKASTSGGSSSR